MLFVPNLALRGTYSLDILHFECQPLVERLSLVSREVLIIPTSRNLKFTRIDVQQSVNFALSNNSFTCLRQTPKETSAVKSFSSTFTKE